MQKRDWRSDRSHGTVSWHGLRENGNIQDKNYGRCSKKGIEVATQTTMWFHMGAVPIRRESRNFIVLNSPQRVFCEKIKLLLAWRTAFSGEGSWG